MKAPRKFPLMKTGALGVPVGEEMSTISIVCTLIKLVLNGSIPNAIFNALSFVKKKRRFYVSGRTDSAGITIIF